MAQLTVHQGASQWITRYSGPSGALLIFVVEYDNGTAASTYYANDSAREFTNSQLAANASSSYRGFTYFSILVTHKVELDFYIESQGSKLLFVVEPGMYLSKVISQSQLSSLARAQINSMEML